MRVSDNEISIIKNSIRKYSDDASIFLFGSRTDDKKKGGDIDIFIDTNTPISLKEKIKILTDIEISGLLRKVDLIIKNPNSSDQPIYTTAKKEGILL